MAYGNNVAQTPTMSADKTIDKGLRNSQTKNVYLHLEQNAASNEEVVLLQKKGT